MLETFNNLNIYMEIISLSSSPGVQYVDRHRSELIQRVQRVMAVSRKLLSMNMINVETYSQIRRAGTKQDRMRRLYVALDEGGHEVKSAFYSALKECEFHLCLIGKDVTENGQFRSLQNIESNVHINPLEHILVILNTLKYLYSLLLSLLQ